MSEGWNAVVWSAPASSFPYLRGMSTIVSVSSVCVYRITCVEGRGGGHGRLCLVHLTRPLNPHRCTACMLLMRPVLLKVIPIHIMPRVLGLAQACGCLVTCIPALKPSPCPH